MSELPDDEPKAETVETDQEDEAPLLTAVQERAIASLLSTASVRKAAIAAQIPERTLYRWMQEDNFRQVYRDARLSVLDTATMKLREATGAAVDTLRELLSSPQHQVKLGAARTILEMAYKSAELGEIQERLEELETAVAEKGNK
jgi:hypothetical protein